MNTSFLCEVAQTFGTPVYVYDEAKIVENYQRLKRAFGKQDVKLHYALKALSNSAILKTLRNQGAGLDAVSIEEVFLGLRAGFEAHEIMYTPNGVAFEEICEAVELGVMVNIDNLSILEKFGARYGANVPVCVRINPHIMAGGHANISVGHIDSKFGISIHQLRHITRLVAHYNLNIVGLHMHTGSDIIDADVFIQGAELLYQAAESFPNLTFMDFGSGFKVAYKEGDIVTPIEQIGKKIGASFHAFCKEYGRDLELWFEPGKFLVSESGTLLVSVNVVKQTTSTVFIGVNSGQNHLIRPMFYNAYHHIENCSNINGEEKLYSVVGYICETDTFGYDRLISEVREGDVLAIRNAGAYGFSMSNQYNARLRPAEVLVRDGKAHLIRRRETLEDIYRNEVEIVEVEQLV
ncbi:MAG: diaminopimelate decarboxylase [Candidatus Fluviicola riflensis]|nr:MAG: diaminopimelate decarboxylase [Candidatus Fluviicola riflensis]OGS79096.1 MAG: diaminopimelate decarboxylase [Candidatus Fluviicola riflensis]OGS86119.1 MAG: diaminopimelate decarboxylase [Fluviicola sp. RIFCSPHIGHO2_12_FULL_43_24]OGS86528.1 MAG: diaminopimelate decarboxylase [Fluviicola sp. RIFCSPHIGHO2_01_FULL_43_53]